MCETYSAKEGWGALVTPARHQSKSCLPFRNDSHNTEHTLMPAKPNRGVYTHAQEEGATPIQSYLSKEQAHVNVACLLYTCYG